MELKIENLSKTYQKGVRALKKVNLNISTNMFGLLGPNGAGKSTLMRTIATLQAADERSVRLDDIDVLKEKGRVRRILGYLPQDFGVYTDVSAEKMLDHISLLKGIVKKKERKEAVNSLLEQTNLYHVRKRKLGGFSNGMKQRFGIAQALIGSPELIIVNEPTAGLDPEERNRFHNLLSEISENVIVILSTHIVDDVRRLCHHMAIIREEDILFSGSPGEAEKNLDGKTWEKVIKKEELPEHEQQFNVILTRLSAGNVLIHVLNDRQPQGGFTSVNPDLEDVYFSTLKHDFSPVQ
ncbi:ABC transporter ATP-binding protein [Acidobacteriota bacterium]